jgi:hypothetical protein
VDDVSKGYDLDFDGCVSGLCGPDTTLCGARRAQHALEGQNVLWGSGAGEDVLHSCLSI